MNRRDGVWRWRNMLSTFVQESFGSTVLTEHVSHFTVSPLGVQSMKSVHPLLTFTLWKNSWTFARRPQERQRPHRADNDAPQTHTRNRRGSSRKPNQTRVNSEAGVVRWMLTGYRVVAWREIGPRYPLHLDAQRTDRDMRVLNLFDVWSKIVSFHCGSKRTERHCFLVRLVHLQSAWQASSRVRRSESAECNYLNWRGAVWSKWRTPP